MNDALKINEKLKELRRAKGLSMNELAHYSGIAQSTLSAIEAGRSSPTVDTLIRVCRVLGVSPASLFEDEGVTDTGETLAGPLLDILKRLELDERKLLIALLDHLTKDRE